MAEIIAADEVKGKASRRGKRPSPLFLHATGQWAKKISGKLRYFGKDDARGEAVRQIRSLPLADQFCRWCRINRAIFHSTAWIQEQIGFLERNWLAPSPRPN